MQFFNLHTHKYSRDDAITAIVNQYPQEFNPVIPLYSIGIHPWYIVESRVTADLEIIENKISNASCAAIGECGLDKRIEIPLDLQLEVFEKQLLLAQSYRKPVVIHCVAAFQEVIQIKSKLSITVPLIIHGFSKNKQVAEQLIANGFYLSFGKYLLQNPALEFVFKAIPNDRFFLETDTVDETIQEVYTLAAKYKNCTVAELQELIAINYKTVFKK
jgi:TatD DNase family protein